MSHTGQPDSVLQRLFAQQGPFLAGGGGELPGYLNPALSAAPGSGTGFIDGNPGAFKKI